MFEIFDEHTSNLTVLVKTATNKNKNCSVKFSFYFKQKRPFYSTMFNYLKLFKCNSNSSHLYKSIKNFNSIQQKSFNVQIRTNNFQISKCNKNTLNVKIKRFNTNDTKANVIVNEVKVQKVKLKASDLKRLLSLAKSEKWSIAGNLVNNVVQSERYEYVMNQ